MSQTFIWPVIFNTPAPNYKVPKRKYPAFYKAALWHIEKHQGQTHQAVLVRKGIKIIAERSRPIKPTKEKWVLVHGFIWRGSKITPHAWCEYKDKVHDPHLKITTTKNEYYSKFKIPHSANLRHFDYASARYYQLRYHYYGPYWMLEEILPSGRLKNRKNRISSNP
jgi:hypothetical protein